MATGAPGTNGVWQYGEDDSEATFSALLNKAAATTDTQIGLDRGRLTTLEARAKSGLIPIIPTSVSISGGTATTSSTGAVTFGTGTTQVTLNGVFTSAYKNYRVVYYGAKNAVAANDFVFLQLTASGTPATTNYYQAAAAFAMSNAAIQNLGGTGATAYMASRIYQSASYFQGAVDLYTPQVVTNSFMTGIAYGTTAADEQQILTSGRNYNNSSYDGVKLFPTANNFSGQIAVYAYED